MGRRGAPQPLRLSDPTGATAATTATSTATTTTTSNSPDASSPNANNLNLNLDSSTFSSHAPLAHQPSPDAYISSAGATAPSSAAASPIDSRASPRSSPRVSPFTSRFSTRRPHTSRAASDERSRPLYTDEHTPPLPDHRPDPSYPSISSKVDARSTTLPTAPANVPQHPPEGVSRLQKAPTEHSKKFSRAGFFHFAKSSKANISLQGSGSGSLSGSRNRSISRGKDSPGASANTGKMSRAYALFAREAQTWPVSCPLI